MDVRILGIAVIIALVVSVLFAMYCIRKNEDRLRNPEKYKDKKSSKQYIKRDQLVAEMDKLAMMDSMDQKGGYPRE